MNELILQFSTSLELASKGIRILSHSQFSHVDGILADENCLGASDPGGVAIRPSEYQLFGIRRRAHIKTPLANEIIALVKTQLGKPFDSTALSNFLNDPLDDTGTERVWEDDTKWFCSELWTWALEKTGFLRIIVPKNRVTPADLLLLLNPWIDDTFWKPVDCITLGTCEQ